MTAREFILVVEHEAAMAEMLRDHFVGQGYEVEVAMHGGDALMLAAQHRPAAVLLDIRLPETPGPAVLSQLRALDDSLAVVLLSGTDDENLARALLKAGAFDYVRKPFDFDRLDHVVALAVPGGQQKVPHGGVLPVRSDRRAAAAAPSADADMSRSRCGLCGQAIADATRAVVDKGASLHATCWLLLRAKTPPRAPEEFVRPVVTAFAPPAAPPAPTPAVQDVAVAAATDANAAKGVEQTALGESGRWWISAWARWTHWKGTLDFNDAVKQELAKYSYLLSVPIQNSTDYEDGLLSYGYSILLAFLEQQRPGFVTKALDSLKAFVAGAPGPGRSVGGHLYDFLVREGRLAERYPEFVKAVLVAAVPTPGLWTQARLLESMTETTLCTHPSARLGDSVDSSEHLTQDTQRFRDHRFFLALPPMTARFVAVASDVLRESRAIHVKLRDGRSDSDAAWVLTMPPVGRADLTSKLIRLAPEGTSVPGLGQDYAALWVAVFNADPEAEKTYELILTVKKDVSRSAATFLPRRRASGERPPGDSALSANALVREPPPARSDRLRT